MKQHPPRSRLRPRIDQGTEVANPALLSNDLKTTGPRMAAVFCGGSGFFWGGRGLCQWFLRGGKNEVERVSKEYRFTRSFRFVSNVFTVFSLMIPAWTSML